MSLQLDLDALLGINREILEENDFTLSERSNHNNFYQQSLVVNSNLNGNINMMTTDCNRSKDTLNNSKIGSVNVFNKCVFFMNKPNVNEGDTIENYTATDDVQTNSNSNIKELSSTNCISLESSIINFGDISLTRSKLGIPEDEMIQIDREKNEIIRKNSEIKKRLIYKIVHPKSMNDLITPNEETLAVIPIENPQMNNDYLLPYYNLKKPCTIKRGRGRPRKFPIQSTTIPSRVSLPFQNTSFSLLKSNQQDNEHQLYKKDLARIVGRTRYGRISKLPSHIEEDFKTSLNDLHKVSEYRNLIEDEDYTYRYKNMQQSQLETIVNYNAANVKEQQRKERKIRPEFQCGVCNKIFLGKRMQKHYKAYPDHNLNDKEQPSKKFMRETSLYNFLLQKIKSSELDEEDRVYSFLNEISDFVEQLQLRNSRLIQSTSGTHFINKKVSKVLGIPEGNYKIDVNAIDALPDPLIRNENNPNLLIPPPPPRLDYNLSISLDETLADAKLNMITSDDSLLVNDLLETGIKNLTNHHNHHHHHHHHHHYDHANDNAIQAADVSMKETQDSGLLDHLTLDLFQFNN